LGAEQRDQQHWGENGENNEAKLMVLADFYGEKKSWLRRVGRRKLMCQSAPWIGSEGWAYRALEGEKRRQSQIVPLLKRPKRNCEGGVQGRCRRKILSHGKGKYMKERKRMKRIINFKIPSRRV